MEQNEDDIEKYIKYLIEYNNYLIDTCIKTGAFLETIPEIIGLNKGNPELLHDIINKMKVFQELKAANIDTMLGNFNQEALNTFSEGYSHDDGLKNYIRGKKIDYLTNDK